MQIRQFKEEDLPEMITIWNKVVEEGNAFPQLNLLDEESAKILFTSQSYTAVAVEQNKVVGLYILHPNNVGRCGHIANASYAVHGEYQGQKIGESLVRDSLKKGKEHGFSLLQFNAVVHSNKNAIHLYEKIGFVKVGTIPNGFLIKNGSYEDIIIYYIDLNR